MTEVKFQEEKVEVRVNGQCRSLYQEAEQFEEPNNWRKQFLKDLVEEENPFFIKGYN